MQRQKFGTSGYTLVQLCVTLAIISVMAAVVYPFVKPPEKRSAVNGAYLPSDLVSGAANPLDLVTASPTLSVVDDDSNRINVGYSFAPAAGSLLEIWNPAQTELVTGSTVKQATASLDELQSRAFHKARQTQNGSAHQP